MKPTRASILSKTEEQFIVTRMSVLRKQQLKTLPDNKILHDFLTCVSLEKTLVAYEDTNSKNRISWHISEGFKLELEESFFECPDKLQKAYEAVRRCFFEDFLDEDDYTELGSQSVNSNMKENLHENLPSPNETEDQIEPPEDDLDEDAMDLLNKVNDLDANTLSADDEEVQADEFSNLSSNEDSQGSLEVEANSNETLKSGEPEVSQNLVSNEEDKTETTETEESEEPQTETTETEESKEPQTETTETEESEEPQTETTETEESEEPQTETTETEESEDPQTETTETEEPEETQAETTETEESEEPQTETTETEESEEPQTETTETEEPEETQAETTETEESEEPQTETTETEESEDPQTETTETEQPEDQSTESEQEKEGDTGPDFDDLAKQLTEVGMEEDKIDSLLSAVRSGKAPLETVQATIDKLKAAQE